MSREYQVSIWEDVHVEKKSDVPAHYEEQKIADIGSNTLSSQIGIFAPNLVTNINGTHTFTFSIKSSYIDITTGTRVKNPLIKYLINERKVKVKWDGQWYDLVIKDRQESTLDKTLTFSCQDLYLNELSKSGFDLDFSYEANNNQGTAKELGKKVLENTDWIVKDGDVINQFKEEPLYEGTLKTDQQLTLINAEDSSIVKTLYGGETLYFFYSDYETIKNNLNVENGPQYQVIYAEEILTESGKMLIINEKSNYITEPLTKQRKFGDIVTISSNISNRYRGKRLIKKQKTIYSSGLKRYVRVYKDSNNNECYGYTSYKYDEPVVVTNFVANPKNFLTTQGWGVGTNETKNESYPVLDTYYHTYTYTQTNPDDNTTTTTRIENNYLSITNMNPSRYITNTGFSGISSYLTEGFCPGLQLTAAIRAFNPSTSSWTQLNNVYIKIVANNIVYFSGNMNIATKDSEDKKWYYCNMTCKDTLSQKEVIKNAEIQIGPLDGNENPIETVRIEGLQIFETKYAGSQLLMPGMVDTSQTAALIYYYFTLNTDKTINYIYKSDKNNANFKPVYNNNPYEKIRSIEVKQSNRFNILQQIAETFQCWVRFKIDHNEDGSVKLQGGIPQKSVTFVAKTGDELPYGFTYGLDLESVSRTIQSNQLVTKLIVMSNSNSVADNGSCNIADSTLNPLGLNVIYNFDYYIESNLLKANTLNNDLYSTAENYIGYYPKMKALTSQYKSLTNVLLRLKNQKIGIDQYYETYQGMVNGTRAQVIALYDNLKKITGLIKEDDVLDYINKNLPKEKKSLWIPYQVARKKVNSYGKILEKLQEQKTEIEKRIKEIEEGEGTSTTPTFNYLLKQIDELNNKLFKKYPNFIQEGTWISEDYADATLYYLDALDVLYTSSRPQVQYEISVARIRDIAEFALRKFKVGDISYIDDPEFFGYTIKNGVPTSYKEPVVISQSSIFFDEPEKDSFTIQNYRTQFEDLFQRITASTQSLQFSQGGYARAAGIVDTNGTINQDVLMNSIYSAKNIVNASQDDTILQDNTGILATSIQDIAQKIKFTPAGILVTQDGGKAWSTILDSEGIPADFLTAGNIKTNKVFITDGEYPTFRWDSKGLNAYSFEMTNNNITGIYPYTYVRFDRFGIYGYNSKSASNFPPSSLQDIYDNPDVKFGLTWEKFFFRGGSGNDEIIIDPDGFFIKRTDNGTSFNKITLGKYIKTIQDNVPIYTYGLVIRNDSAKAVLYIDKDGNLVTSGVIYASGGTIGRWEITSQELSQSITTDSGTTYSVHLTNYDNSNLNSRPFFVRKVEGGITSMPFSIDRQGNLIASSATFNGSMNVSGSMKVSGSASFFGSLTKIQLDNGEASFYYNNKYYGQITTTITDSEKYWTLLGNPSEIDAITMGYEYSSTANTPSPNPAYKLYSDGSGKSYTIAGVKQLSYHEFFGGAYFANGLCASGDSGFNTLKAKNATVTDLLGIKSMLATGNIVATGNITVVKQENNENTGKITCASADIKKLTCASADIEKLTISGTINTLDTDIEFQANKGIKCYTYNGLKFYVPLQGASEIICGDSSVDTTIRGRNIYLKCSDNGGVYTSSGIQFASDRRLKNTINTLSPKYLDFLYNLRPVSFKFNNENASGKLHTGFIAQEVKEALESSGLTVNDFDGYNERESNEEGMEGYICSLKYTDFIALAVAAIQDCQKEITSLKEEIKRLTN